MSSTNVNYQYAQSIYQLAKDKKVWESVKTDLEELAHLWKEQTELGALLSNPIYKLKDKEALLEKLFAQKIHKLSYFFLKLLLQKKRISQLGEILATFQSLNLQEEKAAEAHVYAATPLTSKQMNDLTSVVQQIANVKKVNLTFTLAPELIGGYILQVDGKEIDMSLHAQIMALRKRWINPLQVA